MPNPIIGTLRQKNNPIWIIIFFVLLASTVLIFHIPEKITAILYLCFFFLLTLINPINGITLMVMSIPFFLGAPHNPYFFLFKIVIYGTLILGFIHLWKQKTSIEIPFKPLVLLLFLSVLFSIPINAKEYYYEFWATPAKEIWFQWVRGHEKFPLFHLRALTNTLSGMLIFILTANLFSKNNADDLKRNLMGMIWMAVIICLIGILFLFDVIPPQPKTYLSLSLAGIHEGAISAFAFNRQYLAQFLLILFPLIFYFLNLNRKKFLRLSIYLLVLGLFIVSLSASMQRSAFLVLFLEMILFGLLYIFLISTRRKKALLFFIIPFFLLAVMILLDFELLNKRFIERLTLWGLSDPDNRRLHLWNTAWHMFTFSPFLGMGLGKYFEFFPEFFTDSRVHWKTFGFVRGEPHSFYLQTLSERGAIGFLLLLFLAAAIVYKIIKKIKEEPSQENKMLMITLMLSLFGWFLLGFFHNVSYVRSLGILFWILMGWLAGLTTPQAVAVKNKLDIKIFFVGLLVLTAAFVYQIKLIYERPINPFFQTGLYNKELLPGGEIIHWTKKRAVFTTPIQNGNIILSFSAPLPGITEHFQKVRFWIGQKKVEILLKDTAWHQIVLQPENPFEKKMLLQLETGYTFNPKKAKTSNDDRDLGIMIREKQEGS